MCLIAFAYKTHPSFELILIANRDEFYARPTRAAQYWEKENHPELLAGKDEQGGGTWMGTTKNGRWGALTNYRDPNWKRNNPPSRGNIVLDFLTTNQPASTFLGHLKQTAYEFEGFNMLAGNEHQLFHYSNVNNTITKIAPGIHGVSNAVLNTPWPKLETLKSELSNCVQNNTLDNETLFGLLKNPRPAADEQLPKTGIPYAWEKAISPVFIQTEKYGTRCSSLLFISKNGDQRFVERRFSEKGGFLEENTFNL